MQNRFVKHYKKFLGKTMDEIKIEVANYHKVNDLYSKYEKLDNLMNSSPELDTPAW